MCIRDRSCFVLLHVIFRFFSHENQEKQEKGKTFPSIRNFYSHPSTVGRKERVRQLSSSTSNTSNKAAASTLPYSPAYPTTRTTTYHTYQTTHALEREFWDRFSRRRDGWKCEQCKQTPDASMETPPRHICKDIILVVCAITPPLPWRTRFGNSPQRVVLSLSWVLPVQNCSIRQKYVSGSNSNSK